MRMSDVFDRHDAEDEENPSRAPKCRTCGSAEVRWRQQGGKWVLFSLQPGVLHKCAAEDLADDFDVVEG